MKKHYKGELERLGEQLRSPCPDSELVKRYAGTLNKAADILHDLAGAQPESPEQIETLRKAAAKFYNRSGHASRDNADLCAIVLRRLDRLTEILHHVYSTDYPTELGENLRREREINARMLEGTA